MLKSIADTKSVHTYKEKVVFVKYFCCNGVQPSELNLLSVKVHVSVWVCAFEARGMWKKMHRESEVLFYNKSR